MASITKLELQQALAARNAELETARLRIAELEGDVAALKTQVARASSAQRGAPTRSAYVPREPSAEVLERRVLMARAKELAAAGKRVVVRGNELIVSN